jgi:SAM-dependent methyltransferase
MAEITTGIRRILARPALYEVVQRLFGARAGREQFVTEFVKPRPGDRILDVGSGTSQLLGCLPSDVRYVGVEPNERYSASARARFGARGTFLSGIYDESRARTLGTFDIVLLSGVVHHLDDQQVASLYRLMARYGLTPSGRLVTVDPVFEAGQASLARWSIAMDRGRNVRTATQYEALAQSVFGSVAGTVRHRRFPPYTHFIMTCRSER